MRFRLAAQQLTFRDFPSPGEGGRATRQRGVPCGAEEGGIATRPRPSTSGLSVPVPLLASGPTVRPTPGDAASVTDDTA